MRFLEPTAVYWLLAIPALWCAWLLHRWHREHVRHVSGLGRGLAKLVPLTGLRRDLAVLVTATLAALALIFAAARPQMVTRIPEYERIDLILVFDRSASMRAADIQPSRFSRASMEIHNFLREKPETISRVGLVVFADTALTLSHLTRDSGILFFFLDWMNEDEDVYFGTDMATALQSALNMAKTEMPQRRKVVVLISDGDDHGDELASVLASFQASNIPIYCIGVGSNSEVPIPAPSWAETPMLRNEAGRVITTTFSEDTLRRIAGVTHGRYFRSTTGLELTKTLRDIAARERRIAQWRDEHHDVHALGLAVAAAALSALLVIL